LFLDSLQRKSRPWDAYGRIGARIKMLRAAPPRSSTSLNDVEQEQKFLLLAGDGHSFITADRDAEERPILCSRRQCPDQGNRSEREKKPTWEIRIITPFGSEYYAN